MAVVDVIKLLDTNKAKLAFLVPLLTTLVVVVFHWAKTGEWNGTELLIALEGVATSLLAAFGAWIAKPGRGEVVLPSASVAGQEPIV